MGYSTKASEPSKQQVATPTQRVSMTDKYLTLVKEYGITVCIFHTTISLISLGACYVAVVRFVSA